MSTRAKYLAAFCAIALLSVFIPRVRYEPIAEAQGVATESTLAQEKPVHRPKKKGKSHKVKRHSKVAKPISGEQRRGF